MMFRDFVQRKASKLGVVGTVKNNPDGSVSVVAEGEMAQLNALLKLVRKGSILSRVDSVEVLWAEPLGKLDSFDILY